MYIYVFQTSDVYMYFRRNMYIYVLQMSDVYLCISDTMCIFMYFRCQVYIYVFQMYICVFQTSDEAVSDLSSLSEDSTDHKSFEEQIAQAVIARVCMTMLFSGLD